MEKPNFSLKNYNLFTYSEYLNYILGYKIKDKLEGLEIWLKNKLMTACAIIVKIDFIQIDNYFIKPRKVFWRAHRH